MANRIKDYIFDADKFIGPVDMNYDWELSEFEASKDAGLIIMGCALPSPSDIECRAERFFEAGLASVSF